MQHLCDLLRRGCEGGGRESREEAGRERLVSLPPSSASLILEMRWLCREVQRHSVRGGVTKYQMFQLGYSVDNLYPIYQYPG